MNRRNLLAGTAAALASVAVVGCLDRGGSGANGSTTATPTPNANGATTGENTRTLRSGTTERPTASRSTEPSTPSPSPTTRDETPSVSPAEPAVLERTIEVRSRECGSTVNEVTIAFEHERISVEGRITGEDGCATAVLEETTYDREADTLRIVVTTERETDDQTACTQCLTEIEYVATVAVGNGPPGTVIVVHRGATGEEEVTRAEP